MVHSLSGSLLGCRDAFMAIKQDLLVSFVDCVERNGAKLATPRTVVGPCVAARMFRGHAIVWEVVVGGRPAGSVRSHLGLLARSVKCCRMGQRHLIACPCNGGSHRAHFGTFAELELELLDVMM